MSGATAAWDIVDPGSAAGSVSGLRWWAAIGPTDTSSAMTFDPDELPQDARYRLAIGSVLPRPIAWVSTCDAAGRPNLAPFSFFTVAASQPLTLVFCPQIAAHGEKDTLRNLRGHGECVVNITNADTAGAMNLSSAELPYGESEFAFAGLTPVASAVVRPPRVGEAPVAFECRVERIVDCGDGGLGSGSAVFARVLRIHVRDDLFDGRHIATDRLRPIGRMAGNDYLGLDGVFSLERPRGRR